MKALRKIILIFSIISTAVIIYVLLNATLYILTFLDIVDVEDLDYLGVTTDYVSLADQITELTDSADNEYKVLGSDKILDDVLKKIGGQKPDECLKYSEYYANELLGKKSTHKYIGSDDKKLILKVAAFELWQGRPVIPRVAAGEAKEIKVNGKTETMYSRHFVTIVRN